MSGNTLAMMARWAVVPIIFLSMISSAPAQDISVAAAADLQFAMQEISSRFQAETGKRVRLTYGSSGNFAQQLENGAPFDIFLSANLDYPRRLEQQGLVEPGTFYVYASGKLAMWVPVSSKLSIDGVRSLLSPSITKIAIANPQHAPYGQAAVAAMKHEEVYDRVKDRLVLGENVAQALSFVISGSTDVGLVALSLAVSPAVRDKGHFIEVPKADYPPIEQAAVILKASSKKEVARQFLEFLKTPAARKILADSGFEVPAEGAKQPR